MPQRIVARLLEEWRAAERRLAETAPESAERDEAQVEADRLRLAYHEAERALRELIRDGEIDRPAPESSPAEAAQTAEG